jgi:hypothetical protein
MDFLLFPGEPEFVLKYRPLTRAQTMLSGSSEPGESQRFGTGRLLYRTGGKLRAGNIDAG